MTRCTLTLLLLAVCGCTSAFRGGRSAPDDESFGRTLRRFVPGRCEDAAHAEREPRISLVELYETATGRVVLVERRFGHDALVVDNAFDDGATRVFELLTREGVLRKWVIPRSGGAPALLAVGSAGALIEPKGHFEAAVFAPALRCALIPMESVITTQPLDVGTSGSQTADGGASLDGGTSLDGGASTVAPVTSDAGTSGAGASQTPPGGSTNAEP
ncbi:MAG TPA: hypothetical protein VGI10_30440 [Polyangiaceae bacterium]|jgi:hypothetical protein